jgi:hypothetical protein
MLKTSKNSSDEDLLVENIRSFEGLKKVRDFWEKVQWYPYSDIDYYLNFAKTWEGFIAPHVMVLSRRGKPVALVIGSIQDKRFNWKIGYKTVFEPKVRCLHIDYAGILGDDSYSNSFALSKEIMNCLARGEADVAYFKFIKKDSAMFQVATRIPSFICRDHFPHINAHWAIHLPDSFDDFFRRLSTRTRTKLRKPAKLIRKYYGEKFYIKCYRSNDDKERALRDIETIAANTYQRGLGVGFQNTKRTYDEWDHAAERKWIRSYVLYINESPCAFNVGYVYGKTYVGLVTAFDPLYKNCSPGTFLFMHVIKDLCLDKNIEVMDFGLGPADYKKKICDQNWNDAAVFIFAPTLKGIKLNLMRSMIVLLSHTARYSLDHLKMTGLVKKKWRQLVTPT